MPNKFDALLILKEWHQVFEKPDFSNPFSRKITLRQGTSGSSRHHYCHLKAHRVRGRNIENYLIGKHREITNYQRKQHVVMSFTNGEKYIVFNDIGKGRRKKEVYDGIKVIIAVNKC